MNNPEKFRLDQPDDPDNGAANGYAANLERRDYVLDKMLEYGHVTQQQHDEAIATPITPSHLRPAVRLPGRRQRGVLLRLRART